MEGLRRASGERAEGAAARGVQAPLLYVLGTGFSGSTLLAFLVDTHADMASVGEVTGPIAAMGDPRRYPCSCGAALADCGFWKDLGERMARRGHAFGPERWSLRFEPVGGRLPRQLLRQSLRSAPLDRARDGAVPAAPVLGDRLRETARRYEAFVGSVREATGRRVFVDATKDPTQARYLLRLCPFDVRLVHLVRDAPAFASSFIKNESGSLDAAIRHWKRTAGHVRRLTSRLAADRVLRVRYEDLCTDTEGELARIARFAGLAPAPGPVDFGTTPHHIIGNRMRLAGSREVRLDESWRERLDASAIQEVQRRTASLRRRFGYA